MLAGNLSEKGIPTPLTRTMFSAPMSRVDILTSKEIKQVLDTFRLMLKYNQDLDRDST
ncbi:helicase HerA-like domain-containing protein [Polaribacter sp. SA4-10]|uniref:helicase HerA-like domain-containing protein n=1 Tax=Polaribacter sp. SA4-10 TaxID=754397 RepID=UPI0012F74813|nr:helicase HerA-like domain-containing protein [Polaribacter sp. SA4-10]